LGLYATFVTIVLLCEIALCILAIVLPEEFKRNVGGFMLDGLKDEFDRDMSFTQNGTVVMSPKIVEFSWASLQIELECCGAQSPNDFSGISWDGSYEINGVDVDAIVPASCCLLNDPGKFPILTTGDFVNLEGCLRNDTGIVGYNDKACIDSIFDYIDKYAHFIIGISAGIGVLELIMIGIAICLCQNAGKRDHTV